MAEYTSIQLAQADINTTATTQAVNNSRDFHDTIGEGLLVTATGVGVVFAVLVIMIIQYLRLHGKFFTETSFQLSFKYLGCDFSSRKNAQG